MLNQSNVKTMQGVTRKNILVDEQNSTALSCTVSNEGVEPINGKKIIKAGTPLAGSLTNRNTPFTVAKDTQSGDTFTSNAVGVVLHDVDVTEGNANSQVLIFGFVDVTKLDSSVVALLTDASKQNMRMIQFVG